MNSISILNFVQNKKNQKEIEQIKNDIVSKTTNVHLWTDGIGIIRYEDKDDISKPYLTFAEIEALILDDTNSVFITNGFYSMYSKYQYVPSITGQDKRAIGFIGLTEINDEPYTWRIIINEDNELKEDEIHLAKKSDVADEIAARIAADATLEAEINNRYTKAESDSKFVKNGIFSLVERITLEEDVTVVRRDMRPDGTPYNFRKIFIDIVIPKISSSRTFFLNINQKSPNISNCVARVGAGNSSYENFILINAEVSFGKLSCDAATMVGARANTSSVIKTGNSDGCFGEIGQPGTLTIYSGISSLVFASLTEVPAGTIISIYGVDNE